MVGPLDAVKILKLPVTPGSEFDGTIDSLLDGYFEELV
jgi:hypothetical protein